MMGLPDMDTHYLPIFLTAEEVATLTGRKFKSKQIEALRAMAIPFRVNAAGKPIVTRVSVEGSGQRDGMAKPKWQPVV